MIKWTICFGLVCVFSILMVNFLTGNQKERTVDSEQVINEIKPNENVDYALLGGGCFWCLEPPFESEEGVLDVVSGYTGGHVKNPSYEAVTTGRTGHVEVVKVTFDRSIITYSQILDIFWRQIDPTDPEGQFADRGSQYRTAIFVRDAEQKRLAEESKERLDKQNIFKDPVVTTIEPESVFYLAEDYHQDYYKKNTTHYQRYKKGSGRADFILNTWKDDK